jgi:dimethylhistidine N-methyltransferase
VTPEPAAANGPVAGVDDAEGRLEVLQALHRRPRVTPAKLLYDAQGSELFEQICRLPEYYLSRVENALLQRNLWEIAGQLGQGVTIIEPGAGAATKVRMLLGCKGVAVAYVPIDVSHCMLTHSAKSLRAEFPRLAIYPICGDFSRHLESLKLRVRTRRVIFFPGSTLGNFSPEEAAKLLVSFREVIKPDGVILIGMDHCKSPSILLPAYNDAAGITAQFNKNLLHRLNRDFSADFHPELFFHSAIWNESERRIEMRLVCRRAHWVHLGPHAFAFDAGEILTTEYSHKPTLQDFARLVWSARLQLAHRWLDYRYMYGVYCLRCAA